MKKNDLGELEDKIKSLTHKKMKLIVDANKLDKELLEITEKFYEVNPEYVKVMCFNCQGQCYVESDEMDRKGKMKMVKCPFCQMKGFLWMKLWIGDSK